MQAVIGLAVGRRTGPELAAVSERTVDQLGRMHSIDIEIARPPRLYRSLKAQSSGVLVAGS